MGTRKAHNKKNHRTNHHLLPTIVLSVKPFLHQRLFLSPIFVVNLVNQTLPTTNNAGIKININRRLSRKRIIYKTQNYNITCACLLQRRKKIIWFNFCCHIQNYEFCSSKNVNLLLIILTQFFNNPQNVYHKLTTLQHLTINYLLC